MYLQNIDLAYNLAFIISSLIIVGTAILLFREQQVIRL